MPQKAVIVAINSISAEFFFGYLTPAPQFSLMNSYGRNGKFNISHYNNLFPISIMFLY